MKIISVLILASLLTSGLIFNYFQHKQPPLVTTTIYPIAKLLAEFELLDHHGQLFNNTQLEGKWSIVFFGYTYCPDICPTTLTSLAQVAEKLAPEILQQLQFIFVSVDPQRDQQNRLAEYIPFFHPDFIAITGKDEQLQKFTLDLGVAYMRVATDDSYMMSHSSTVFLINPKAERYGIFSRNYSGAVDIPLVAQDLDSIIRYNELSVAD